MRLLILADIHGGTKAIGTLSEAADGCDAVILAGDITNFGGRAELAAVIEPIESFGKPIMAVSGNCDPPAVDQELERRHVSIDANIKFINDYAFFGAGGSLPCPGATPNEIDECAFGDILEEAVTLSQSKKLVLVTHQPAWGTKLDTTFNGRHTGSRAIRHFIERYKPVLAISGHMHEAFGTDQLEPTTLVNPGAFRQGRYAIADLNVDGVQVQLFQLKN